MCYIQVMSESHSKGQLRRWAKVDPADRAKVASHAAKSKWDGMSKKARKAQIQKMIDGRNKTS